METLPQHIVHVPRCGATVSTFRSQRSRGAFRSLLSILSGFRYAATVPTSLNIRFYAAETLAWRDPSKQHDTACFVA